jgi:hypothetical protein
MTTPDLLMIEHMTTADMPDGQSLPPFIDEDGALWRVVRRLAGARTLWRRIRLSSDYAITGRSIAEHLRVAADTTRHDKGK